MSELSGANSHFIIGYSGCDRDLGEAALASPGANGLASSNNGYDWLGTGVYFWENDPVRAYQWAVEAKVRHEKRNKETGAPIRIRRPFVVGAVIRLGACLDFTTREGVELVKEGYQACLTDHENLLLENPDIKLPENTGDDDMKGRYLDFHIINFTCQDYAKNKKTTIDTVRSFFHEGDRIYPGAGFREKTHIQICVRETNKAILGYFRVPKAMSDLAYNQ